jgi:hypothetical protein
MSQITLVRHPAPHSTESLMGYVLRLSADNGYKSPWSIYQLAHMKQSEARRTGMRVDKLAAISLRPESELSQIAFAPPEARPRWCCLLGHDLVPTDLSMTDAAFCPQCASEQGFIEAHWHLRLMVGCSIHASRLSSCCPGCGKRIRWFRPGLLECECGFDLRNGNNPAIPFAEAKLLNVIRRKVLRLPDCQENQSGLPETQLLSMSLRSILVVIQVLGKYRLIADGSAKEKDEFQSLSAAARVLADWPQNFFTLLELLGDRVVGKTNAGVRKQFENIYVALFKNKTIQPPEQTDFIKDAFVDFAANYWGRGVVDSRFLGKRSGCDAGRFMTRAAFARKIGVQPRTAAKILADRRIPSKRVECGAASRVLIDVEKVLIPCTSPGTVLRCREAARQLEMSPALLNCLRRRAIYGVQHLSPTRPGFHHLDVELFRQRILNLAQASDSSADFNVCGISFGSALRNPHYSVAAKVAIIEAILRKEIVVLNNANGTFAGLQLEASSCQQTIRDANNTSGKELESRIGTVSAVAASPRKLTLTNFAKTKVHA